MNSYEVKDNFGTFHTIEADSVQYVEHMGRIVEARFVQLVKAAEDSPPVSTILAVFHQWHWIKQVAPPQIPEQPK